MFKIFSYNVGSKSAKAISTGLSGRIIKKTNSRYIYNPRLHRVINWGCGNLLQDSQGRICIPLWNQPDYVRRATNKLKTFEKLKEDNFSGNLPEFTTEKEVAEGWKGIKVCRQKLTGHSGEGIIIIEDGDTIPDGIPLYVRYIPKKREIRIHIFDGEMIAWQEKKRKREIEDVNWRVRSHSNGFVYCREGAQPDERVVEAAKEIMKILQLDFAALDFIYNEKKDSWYFLESNTAPGLEGETVNDYIKSFRKIR